MDQESVKLQDQALHEICFLFSSILIFSVIRVLGSYTVTMLRFLRKTCMGWKLLAEKYFSSYKKQSFCRCGDAAIVQTQYTVIVLTLRFR